MYCAIGFCIIDFFHQKAPMGDDILVENW